MQSEPVQKETERNGTMQESTLQQVAAACVQGLSHNEIVSCIYLRNLDHVQKAKLLEAVRSRFGDFPSAEIIDDAAIVFHGTIEQAKIYLAMIDEAIGPSTGYLRIHAESLRKVVREGRDCQILFQGVRDETLAFFGALYEASVSQNVHFLQTRVRALLRQLSAA